MHSNRDLETTTPLTLRRDHELAATGQVSGVLGGTPEHGESGRRFEPVSVDEPDELTPGPSDVNGG